MDIVVTMVFGKDRHYKPSNEQEKEMIRPMAEAYSQHLLDFHDNHPEMYEGTPKIDRNIAGMQIDFREDYAPGFGHVTLYLFTLDVEGLRAGKGDLNFIWPEGFDEYLVNLYDVREGHEE